MEWLEEYAKEAGCLIHAYALMTNHVHILLTPSCPDSAGKLMKRLGQRYVQYINRAYKRSGTLWVGRFRSCIINQKQYLFFCQRYIEMNSVRAGMVTHPRKYRWSSYLVNAQGAKSSLISHHPLYLDLGQTDTERQAAYCGLFNYELDSGKVDKIRRATNGNFALGDSRFVNEITEMIVVIVNKNVVCPRF